MTEYIKRRWWAMSPLMRRLSVCGAVLCLCCVFVALATDSDSDGMSDAWEVFYGLNPNDPADASLNYDEDTLTNLAESVILTDPYATDTDRDGFHDGIDDNAISRFFAAWGTPLFTDGDEYNYAAPEWILGAYRISGDWLTNPVCWHVSASESNNIGSLDVDLDRGVLTNNLVCKLVFYDHQSASLYVDLINTNSEFVETNLFGNLLDGNNVTNTLYLDIPLETCPEGAVIHLRRGTGEITVYESLLYIDIDGDGLDKEQEYQLGTSDNDTDSDDDGRSDYDEVFVYGTDPAIFDDWVDPEVIITGPTTNAYYTTNTAIFAISGVATDNVGVTEVKWSSNRGGYGTCDGTNSWSADNVTLYWGTNVITVTAYDAEGNLSSDMLTVTVDSVPEEGLKVWVQADAGITKDTNDCVSLWTDQSGNGNNFGSYGTGKPLWQDDRLNGEPALKFDGSSDYMTNSCALTGEVTVLIVRRYASFSAKHSLFNNPKSSTPDGGFYMGSSGTSSPYDRQAVVSGCGGTWVSGVNSQDIGGLTTNWALDTLRISTNQTEFWTDAALLMDDHAHGAIAAGNALTLGEYAADPGTTYCFDGETTEILVYNGALSNLDLIRAEDYISDKYGIELADVDRDGDGLPDRWEWEYFGDLDENAEGDPDNDGVNNLDEYLQGRDPTSGTVEDTEGLVNLKVFTVLE